MGREEGGAVREGGSRNEDGKDLSFIIVACRAAHNTCVHMFIYKWHVCPGSYNKNPEEEQEEEVEEKK